MCGIHAGFFFYINPRITSQFLIAMVLLVVCRHMGQKYVYAITTSAVKLLMEKIENEEIGRRNTFSLLRQ